MILQENNFSRLPTPAEISALTAFLPLLYAPGFEPAAWIASEQRPDGAYTFPYPSYAEQVVKFFHLAGEDQWCDFTYASKNISDWIRDDLFMAEASLDQVRSMLTWCVRGERFCDGHWAAVIEDGIIRKLLERLIVLNRP
jgi:hypothetical protein